MTDITILTDPRYVKDDPNNQYKHNVYLEDQLLLEAFKKEGINSNRKAWDDQTYDWRQSKSIIFRSTWDYFDRYNEFSPWLTQVAQETRLINSKNIIEWNIDKHYLQDLEKAGVTIPKSVFIEKGNVKDLDSYTKNMNCDFIVLKPCISGAARLTYKISTNDLKAFDNSFKNLLKQEAFIIQEFLHPIENEGELSLILFNGVYSHAVLKKAKAGDFRVQDDHGGSVHKYVPLQTEIEFAENTLKACPEIPAYARVDIARDNTNKLTLIELELIEPELWLRHNSESANRMAKAIKDHLNQ